MTSFRSSQLVPCNKTNVPNRKNDNNNIYLLLASCSKKISITTFNGIEFRKKNTFFQLRKFIPNRIIMTTFIKMKLN